MKLLYVRTKTKGGSIDGFWVNPQHVKTIQHHMAQDDTEHRSRYTFKMTDGSTIENIYEWEECDETHQGGKDA